MYLSVKAENSMHLDIEYLGDHYALDDNAGIWELSHKGEVIQTVGDGRLSPFRALSLVLTSKLLRPLKKIFKET